MKTEQLTEKRQGIKCLNAFYLKIIAVISMTIDHIGAVLLPQYLILRVMGRIAFPIYCFLLVNGFFHTSNVKRYIARLGVFAIISEVFFDKVFFGKYIDMRYQNVFFTLFIGIVMLTCVECIRRHLSIPGGLMIISYALEGVCVVSACGMAFFTQSDYSFYGILMIYWFYALRYNKVIMGFFQAYTNLELMGGLQGFACVALLPIYLYNGEKGYTGCKGWFYIYYPLHLLVIGILKAAI